MFPFWHVSSLSSFQPRAWRRLSSLGYHLLLLLQTVAATFFRSWKEMMRTDADDKDGWENLMMKQGLGNQVIRSGGSP
jgi:hypothetical protein